MRKYFILVWLCIILSYYSVIAEPQYVTKYKNIIDEILTEAVKDSSSWERLAYMCDTFGPRLSGSDNLNNSIAWIFDEMKKDGFKNVHLEEVMVPHWVRGNEKCEMIEPRYQNIPVLAIGGTIGTPEDGITAEVVVVNSFEQLERKKEEVKNKIVLFDVPFTSYGPTVQYRVKGAFAAAQYGALASLIRAVSPIGFNNPHTGMMRAYPDTVRKIPHAAISLEDSEMLHRLYDRGQHPVITLKLEAQTLEDVLSYNVMGEIKGVEKPEEIIAVGGHIDSWDTGTGAQDDGSGCIATWEAVKLLHDIGIKPKRTIRVVMWVNEENGVRGGKAYAEVHKEEPHSLMFEFDSGVFPPERIGYRGPDSLFEKVKEFEPLLKRIGDIEIHKGGGGVDISPMMKTGIPGMSLNTDDGGKYFWYHHSPADTPDKVDEEDMNKCVAAIAAAIYLYSELP